MGKIGDLPKRQKLPCPGCRAQNTLKKTIVEAQGIKHIIYQGVCVCGMVISLGVYKEGMEI